jgi:hypothetical protein
MEGHPSPTTIAAGADPADGTTIVRSDDRYLMLTTPTAAANQIYDVLMVEEPWQEQPPSSFASSLGLEMLIYDRPHKHVGKEDWERYKRLISDLYLRKGQTVSQMREYMERTHAFRAT